MGLYTMEKMDDFKTFEDLAFEFYEDLPLSYELWHYTTANGMNGILQNDNTLHFWFTRYDCLNDTSEGKEINEYYKSICSYLYQNNEISKEFYDCIKDLKVPAMRDFEYPLRPSTENHSMTKICRASCDAFICCFSLKENSVDMWRYYSKSDGGYALQFPIDLFEYWDKTLYFDPRQYPRYASIEKMEVIYSWSEKRKLLTEMIKKVYSAFCGDESVPDKKAASTNIICSELQRLQFKFKHECFASEKEYRFVLFLPKEKPAEMQQELPPVQFRTVNGLVIPYVDIEIPNGNELLQKLLVSPFLKESAKENALRSFLDARGFHKCNIAFSSLPVRLL